MQDYQRQFIQLALENQALQFGDFTLKSGRKSPYFFNMGCISDGHGLATLGQCYAKALHCAEFKFDCLFGPAYKGIPLATATSMALSQLYGQSVGCAFNRKEPKDHGEKGLIIGSPLASKRVCLIDDVITAGTALRQAIECIQQEKAILTGVIVALDRQERGNGNQSALQELQKTYQIPIASIIALDDLIDYLQQEGHDQNHFDRMKTYQQQFSA